MTETYDIRGEEISEKRSQIWAKMRLSLLGEGLPDVSNYGRTYRIMNLPIY